MKFEIISLKISTDFAIIGGHDRVNYRKRSYLLKDVEVIAILNGSISYINKATPSLPEPMDSLRGARLSNGDLLLCGGRNVWNLEINNQYLLFQEGSSQWKKIGTMKKPIYDHSAVFMDGRLFTCGGRTPQYTNTPGLTMSTISHHEAFLLGVGVKKKKEMPLALRCHSATKIGQHKMLICGGLDKHVRKTFFMHQKATKLVESIFSVHF